MSVEKVMDASACERALVLRLIAGDEEAFCELYTHYKGCLIYFALRYLKSREYAEDIFQDTFAALWQGRKFINPDASFSSYLYTIMRNRILNQLRDLDKETALKEEILSQAIDYGSDASQTAALAELESILTRAIHKLTPRQQEVFEMSRVKRMSHKEIAQALGISVYTVQEYISVSLSVIRKYLSANYAKQADLILLLLVVSPSL